MIIFQKTTEKSENSIEYAIITALEDDEMEKILPFIIKISEVENTNNYIERINVCKNCNDSNALEVFIELKEGDKD